jgi:putative peptidoglycan lipid II flippase
VSINSNSKQLIRGTGIVAALTLLSRFFGFVRDLLVARLFGASAIADCFFVAFRIPNLLRSFVAEGALSAAFVPIFTSELKSGRERAQAVISLVIGFLTIVTFILTILGIIFADDILRLIAPGFMQRDNAPLCILLTQIMMPYIICVSLVAMLNGALNSVNVFGAAAMAQVAMNLTLIAGALIAGGMNEVSGVKVLSYSVLAGGIVQVIIQIPALSKAGFKFRPKFNIFSSTISDLLKLMTPAILGATIYQISQFINTLFASLLSTGSVSWLFYADRLTQLPLGIFSIALASVLLPTLSRASVDNNQKDFSAHLTDSLRYTSFFIIPISGIIFQFSDSLISILFERGEFSHLDTYNTALAVKAYALGLWTVSCYSMISRAFIAKKDTVTPSLVGLATLIVGIFLSLLWMGPFAYLPQSQPGIFLAQIHDFLVSKLYHWDLGHAGLALSSSVASFFSFIVLGVILSLRHLSPGWGKFAQSSFKALASTMAALYIASSINFLMLSPRVQSVLQILVAGMLFMVFSLLLRSSEANEVLKTFKGRLARR